jgi:hypothetical protein
MIADNVGDFEVITVCSPGHQGQQPFGLHQQAGHMTASDLCAARPKEIPRQAGAIHT